MQTSTQIELAPSGSGLPPQTRRSPRRWYVLATVLSLLAGVAIGLAAYNSLSQNVSLTSSPSEDDWDVASDLGDWATVNDVVDPVLPVPDAADLPGDAPTWGALSADHQVLPVGGPEWAAYEVPDAESAEQTPVWLDGTIELIDETDALRAPPRQVSGPPAFRQ